MRQRFEPGEQQQDYLLSRRTDSINRNAGSYLGQFLASRNAFHLERFRPKPGGSGSRELHDSEMGYEGDEE